VTERQQQIVRLLAAGGTNRELAKRLGVREQTVKNQLSRIYTKLGVRNRLELAVYAARHGLGPDADGRGR
jgi:DNA-binding NarL/FixJ family response regulator